MDPFVFAQLLLLSAPRYYVRVLDNRGFGQPDPA